MNSVRGLQDNSDEPQDCNQQIAKFWGQVPTFCRFVMITAIGIYLISFLIPQILYLFMTTPYLVVYQLEIWRLATGQFVHPQLLLLLFSLLSYIPTAIVQEKLDGTLKQTYRFFALSIIIEIIFVAFAYVLSFYIPQIMLETSIGLWPILFCDIVIECNRSPDISRGLCCLPIQIKAKYYPWILIILFTIFFQFQLSLFVGLGVGYMYFYGYLKFIDLSLMRAKRWESKFPFKQISSYPTYISIDNATGSANQIPTYTRQNPPNIQAQQRQTFQSFQGRGMKLGSSEQNRETRNQGNMVEEEKKEQKNRNVAQQSILVNKQIENQDDDTKDEIEPDVKRKGDYQEVKQDELTDNIEINI